MVGYASCKPADALVFKFAARFQERFNVLPHAVNCGWFCFGEVSLCFFVYEMSREPLNGSAPNSHGRRVWSLARMSLKVMVKSQKSRSPETKTAFFGPFGGLRAVCLVKASLPVAYIIIKQLI